MNVSPRVQLGLLLSSLPGNLQPSRLGQGQTSARTQCTENVEEAALLAPVFVEDVTAIPQARGKRSLSHTSNICVPSNSKAASLRGSVTIFRCRQQRKPLRTWSLRAHPTLHLAQVNALTTKPRARRQWRGQTTRPTTAISRSTNERDIAPRFRGKTAVVTFSLWCGAVPTKRRG